MREIKFRAWDSVMGKWISDYLINPFGQIMCLGSNMFYNGLHDTKILLSQFIGLQDRNDKEIYQGDVLRYEYYHPTKGKIIYENEVVFDEGKACFACEYMDGEYHYFGDKIFKQQCEVVGNIYEDQALLNKELFVKECDASKDEQGTKDGSKKDEY